MINYVEMKNITSLWLATNNWYCIDLEKHKEFQRMMNEFYSIGFEYFDMTIFEEVVREKVSSQFKEHTEIFQERLILKIKNNIAVLT